MSRGQHAAPPGLSRSQATCKRAMDLLLASSAAVVTAPLMALAVLMATIDTRKWGVFSQERIGKDGRRVRIHKIRTMRPSALWSTTVTTSHDPRITTLGAFFRATKIDELPQFIDVVCGSMSIVGPRPDVPGWADLLDGEDKVVLSVRPGITGPASLAFRHEERLLAEVEDPESFNREVIWPEKVRINREYVDTWSLKSDLEVMWSTAISIIRRVQ